jgi:hypothetical protein
MTMKRATAMTFLAFAAAIFLGLFAYLLFTCLTETSLTPYGRLMMSVWMGLLLAGGVTSIRSLVRLKQTKAGSEQESFRLQQIKEAMYGDMSPRIFWRNAFLLVALVTMIGLACLALLSRL